MCCYVLSVTEACVPRDVALKFLEEQHSCKSQEINLFLLVPGVLVLVKYMIGNDNQNICFGNVSHFDFEKVTALCYSCLCPQCVRFIPASLFVLQNLSWGKLTVIMDTDKV